jgi:hypothetical protein
MIYALIIGVTMLAVLACKVFTAIAKRRAASSSSVSTTPKPAPSAMQPTGTWWAIGALTVVALVGGYMLFTPQKNNNVSSRPTAQNSNQPERVAFAYKFKNIGIANEIWGEARGKGIPAGNYCQQPAGLTLYFLAGDQAVTYLGSEDIVIPPGKKVMAIKTDHNEVSIYPGTCKALKTTKQESLVFKEALPLNRRAGGLDYAIRTLQRGKYQLESLGEVFIARKDSSWNSREKTNQFTVGDDREDIIFYGEQEVKLYRRE